MSKNILAAIGALAIVVIIGGGAFRTLAPGAAPAQQQTAAKSISQLPITQHFSSTFNMSSINTSPMVLTMPPTAGMAIGQFTFSQSGGNHLLARINGSYVFKGCMGFSFGGEIPPFSIVVNPPIIVRPGQTLEMGTDTGSRDVTVGGYVLYASDFGQ